MTISALYTPFEAAQPSQLEFEKYVSHLNPLFWYKCDDDASTQVLKDSGSGELHLTPYGTPVYGQPGPFKGWKSIYFNGSSLFEATSIPFADTNNIPAYTVACWLRPDDWTPAANMVLATTRSDSANSSMGMNLQNINGGELRTDEYPPSNSHLAYSTTSVEPGWYWCVIVKGTSRREIWMNGTIVAQDTSPELGAVGTMVKFSIGGRYYSSTRDNFLIGHMCNVVGWETDLTQKQIRSMYQRSVPQFNPQAAGPYVPEGKIRRPSMLVRGKHPEFPVRIDPDAERRYGDIFIASSQSKWQRLGHRPVDYTTFWSSGNGIALQPGRTTTGSHLYFDGTANANNRLAFRYQHDVRQWLSPGTVFAVAWRETTLTGTGQIIGLVNMSTRTFRLTFQTDGRVTFQIYGVGANAVNYSDAGATVGLHTYRIVGVHYNDTDHRLWVHDGKRLVSYTTNTTDTSVGTDAPLSTMLMGVHYNSGYSQHLKGGVQMAGWSDYPWSPGEVEAWLRNPYRDLVPA